MKIKFNSDDNSDDNSVVRTAFQEDKTYYPKCFLDECLYEL